MNDNLIEDEGLLSLGSLLEDNEINL